MIPTILITRPLDAAKDFERLLYAKLGADIPCVVSPLLDIRHLSPKIDVRDVQTVFFTSAHAVRAFAKLTAVRGFVCYVVGSATGEAARSAGFDPIEGGGSAESLAKRLLKDHLKGTILYPRGTHVAFDFASALAPSEADFRQEIVYDQCATALSSQAQKILSGKYGVVLPLFSPRSATLFFDNNSWNGPLFVGAMSDKVARTVPVADVAKLSVAEAPTTDAMLNLVERLWADANHLEGNSSAK